MAVRRSMIIYAKSFSNPSVSISPDATGLSAACIVVFPDHTHLLFLTRTLSKFYYTLIRKTVLPPWRPGIFINLNIMNNLGRESAMDHFVPNYFQI